LGRVNCVLGKYENAQDWYDAFSDLRPNNPIGQLERRSASLALEISKLPLKKDITCLIDDTAGGTNNRALTVLLDKIQNTRFESSVLERIAYKFFFQKEYQAASCVYQLIDTLNLKTAPNSQFMWYLASELSRPSSPDDSSEIPLVYLLQDTMLIEARNLRWVNPLNVLGQSLAQTQSPNSVSGVMWWTGSAVALINVVNPGMFQVTTRAQNSSPAPIELQLEYNFEPVENFLLNKGDLSWDEFYKELYLKEGLNLIGIRYLNDGKVNELDRNAYIQWIKLERK
jgi:hypothetical protein